MLEFIEENSKKLDEYLNLTRILDSNSAVEIQDIMISLKHVMSALLELSQFHIHSGLNDKFDIARYKANQIIESSTPKAEKLNSMLALQKTNQV